MDKKRLFKEEFLDICAGVAFPMIVQIMFSVTIIMFADYAATELWIGIVALVVGEAFIFVAYFMFGNKNGSVAYTNFVVAEQIRVDGQPDYRRGGEYKPYKGFLIGFISTIPYLIFHIFYCIFPNADFLEFILLFGFGWAVYPIYLGTNSINALSMLFVFVLTAIHGVGYIVGKNKEFKRREAIRIADEATAAEFERRERERQERAERQREQAREQAKKKKK